MVKKQSHGPKIPPDAFWINLSFSDSSCVLVTTKPATKSECPPIYFVPLWIIISASHALGCWAIGLENVLSTTKSASTLLAILDISLISDAFKVGLVGDSIHTNLVLRLIT